VAKVGTALAGNGAMTFLLAFDDLDAAAPRQRARCAATGRFVAWSKVPQLRVPGAPRVVVIPAPVAEVADVAEVAPVAPVAEVAPVAVVDGAEAVEAPPVVGGGLLSTACAHGARVVAGAAALVGAAGRWFRSKASALVAGARAAVAAGALAIGDGAPPVAGGAAAAAAATITGGVLCD
jgi:hypothetical protein